MILVSCRPGRLTLRGHAGHSPGAPDIVCAAVSILAETLCRLLPPGDARLGEGFAEFSFSVDCPQAAFVLTGLALLAENYPQSVQFVPAPPEDDG